MQVHVGTISQPVSIAVVVVVVVGLVATTLLISQVISAAFDSGREKADKFFSETLISA